MTDSMMLSPAEHPGFEQHQSGELSLQSTDERRAIAQVLGRMQIAKRFPRNIEAAKARLAAQCARAELANKAFYSYERGGTKITGPSVHLLRAVAGAYQNIDAGWREVGQEGDRSIVESYAWDLETNSTETRSFIVLHYRTVNQKTGGKLKYRLDDPRDIYEMVANLAARRTRACLENVIDPAIVKFAEDACKATLKQMENLPERIQKMVKAFGERFKVTPEQISAHMNGVAPDKLDFDQFVYLNGVYQALEEGTPVTDYFGEGAPAAGGEPGAQTGKPATGAEQIKQRAAAKKADEQGPQQEPQQQPQQQQPAPTKEEILAAVPKAQALPEYLRKAVEKGACKFAFDDLTAAWQSLPDNAQALSAKKSERMPFWGQQCANDTEVTNLTRIIKVFDSAAQQFGFATEKT